MKATADKLCDLFGVDRRTVTNWLNSDPPCPSKLVKGKREFDTVEVTRWKEAYAVQKQTGKSVNATTAFNDARARKMDLDAQLAEIEVRKAEGQLVPIEVFEQEIDRAFARVKQVLITIPSKFLGRIQVTRTELEAQAVGEVIRDELLTALQGIGEDDAEEGDVAEESAA